MKCKELTEKDILSFLDLLKRSEKAFDSLIKPNPKMVTNNDLLRSSRDTVKQIREEFEKRFLIKN